MIQKLGFVAVERKLSTMVSVKDALLKRVSDTLYDQEWAWAVFDVMALMMSGGVSCENALRRTITAVGEIRDDRASETSWNNEVLADPVNLGDIPGFTLKILGEACDDNDIQVITTERGEIECYYVYFSCLVKNHNIPLNAFNSWSRLGGGKGVTSHAVLFYEDIEEDGIIAKPIDGETYGLKVYGFKWGESVDYDYEKTQTSQIVPPDVCMGVAETLGLWEA